MRDQPNDRVGHTTDCRPAWNKYGLGCIISFNTHLSNSRPWFSSLNSSMRVSWQRWTARSRDRFYRNSQTPFIAIFVCGFV